MKAKIEIEIEMRPEDGDDKINITELTSDIKCGFSRITGYELISVLIKTSK